MFINLFILILTFLSINISHQNFDINKKYCWKHCWKNNPTRCPNKCWNKTTKHCNNKCWEDYCKTCNVKFNKEKNKQHELVDKQIEFFSSQTKKTNYYNNWDDEFGVIPREFNTINFEKYLPTIENNINIKTRSYNDDLSLFLIFYDFILKEIKKICSKKLNNIENLNEKPWTQLLCEKVERIDQTYIKITSYFKSYDALFTVEFVKMSIYLYNYYTGKSKFCEENVTQKRYNELNGKINLRINSDNEKQRLINLQKLNDYIDEMIGNGLKFLPFLKNFEFDSELLKKFPPEIKKKIKQNIYQNLKDIGCEITLAVKTLCEQVSVNCNQIKPALSIFAVDIFITSIMANDFDKLAGKWPIAIFKNFDENWIN